MKKLFTILFVGLLCFITSCSKEIDKEKSIKSFTDYANNLEQYQLKGEMEIARKSDSVKFQVCVDYLNPNYYKVTLDNAQNNNRQIIVKNDEGVHVLTPALNKVFKFDSDWPLNSSHGYLLNSLVKDIANDENANVFVEDGNIVIKSAVNHKTNKNLTYQKITLDAKTYQLKKVVVYDSSDTPQLKFNVANFTEKPNLTKTNFDVTKTMEDNVAQLSEGQLGTVSGTLSVSYVIDGSELATTSTTTDVTIMCFTGEKEYTIISRKTVVSDVFTPVRIYSDLAIMNDGLAVFSDNSLTFLNKDLEVSIISSSLTQEELVNIANSLTWA